MLSTVAHKSSGGGQLASTLKNGQRTAQAVLVLGPPKCLDGVFFSSDEGTRFSNARRGDSETFDDWELAGNKQLAGNN